MTGEFYNEIWFLGISKEDRNKGSLNMLEFTQFKLKRRQNLQTTKLKIVTEFSSV